jgi:branched-chain amino acid transport system permease protein
MNYVLHILIMINIYVVLALSLNLVVGYTGLLSLSHAAFYGIGAYTSTLLMIKLDFSFFPSLLIAVLVTGVSSLLISIPSLKIKRDYFVLASIGFQMIFFSLLYNWTDLTQGAYGIPGIPQPTLVGLKINTIFMYFLFTCVLALACVFLIYLLTDSPFGRILKAVRDDELAASALGKNPSTHKVTAFAIAAGFAALAGSLFAGYMRYIEPTSFTLMESIFILSIIIMGGAGNIAGPLIGAVIMIVLPEILRFLYVPETIAPNVRQIIYGSIIIIIMRYRPKGILGEYVFK